MSQLLSKAPILSTAGAIPVKTAKGKLSMQKVKVQRYVAGKRPEYAPDRSDSDSDSDQEGMPFEGRPDAFGRGRREDSDDDDDDDDDGDIDDHQVGSDPEVEPESQEDLARDARLRRLRHREALSDDDDADATEETRLAARKQRHIREPEELSESGDEAPVEITIDTLVQRGSIKGADYAKAEILPGAGESSDEDEDLDDEQLEQRRLMLRQRAKERQKDEELMAQEDEAESGEEESEEEEESEYEEYSDSDEDETGPRLKPVFVRKRDRVTLRDTEKEQQRLKELQLEQKKAADERKKQSVKLVEDVVRREIEMEKNAKEDKLNIDAVCTDDESEELAYEQWKLRELKRIKRDKEEREALEKERTDMERIHNMTEEERRAFLRANPKVITNKAVKGKYKFLQKYYHRGAFYLDEEDTVFKRDYAQPTLDDHFDKTVVPTVMQVKNFGMAGRTKYTHLVDQDTTDFNAPWVAESATNLKFFTKHAAGIKDIFERPSAAKKRKKL